MRNEWGIAYYLINAQIANPNKESDKKLVLTEVAYQCL